MPALDTNALVRCIVQNDSSQRAAAKRLIGRCAAEGSTLFVPVTGVLELLAGAWIRDPHHDKFGSLVPLRRIDHRLDLSRAAATVLGTYRLC